MKQNYQNFQAERDFIYGRFKLCLLKNKINSYLVDKIKTQWGRKDIEKAKEIIHNLSSNNSKK